MGRPGDDPRSGKINGTKNGIFLAYRERKFKLRDICEQDQQRGTGWKDREADNCETFREVNYTFPKALLILFNIMIAMFF